MFPLESFVQTYGYLAIFLGTFLEGETILLIGGFLVYRGYLTFPLLIFFAFLGSFLSDQLLFLLGRYHGRRFFKKFPKLQPIVHRIHAFLHTHQNSLILGSRFAYGFRILIPFAIGTSTIRTKKFLALSTISTLLWSVLLGMLGYLLGTVLETILGKIKHLELEIVLGLVVIGFVIWIVRLVTTKKKYAPA